MNVAEGVRPLLRPEVGTLLVAALRSGKYKQGYHGRLGWGMHVSEEGAERPAEWEAAGVLCDVAVKKDVIDPPTKVTFRDEVTWLYRSRGDDAVPSCISIPDAVLEWADMRLSIGDPLVINGMYRTWAGHADNRVPFLIFADALEAVAQPLTTPTEEATVV